MKGLLSMGPTPSSFLIITINFCIVLKGRVILKELILSISLSGKAIFCGYTLEQPQAVGIVGVVGMVGIVRVVGINLITIRSFMGLVVIIEAQDILRKSCIL